MKVLVTGLNGLIGWHCFRAAEKRAAADGTYRRACRPLKLKTNCHRVNLDTRTPLRLFLRKIRPTHIIHARSICDLDVCEVLPELAERINVTGTALLIEEALRLGTVRKFCYISTDHVFDGNTGNYTEDDRPRPKHVYGRTKWAAESLVRNVPLPWNIIRPSLVIGKSLQGNKGPRDWLFGRVRAGKPSHLFRDEWRTPISAGYLAERVLDITCSTETGLFHMAGATTFSRYELGCALAESAGLTTDNVIPRLRSEDKWAVIRPEHLTLRSLHIEAEPFKI